MVPARFFVKHTTKKRKSENDHSQVKEINTFSSLKTLQDLDLFNMEQHHFWHQWSFLIILLVSHVGLIDGNGAVLEGIHSEVRN